MQAKTTRLWTDLCRKGNTEAIQEWVVNHFSQDKNNGCRHIDVPLQPQGHVVYRILFIFVAGAPATSLSGAVQHVMARMDPVGSAA